MRVRYTLGQTVQITDPRHPFFGLSGGIAHIKRGNGEYACDVTLPNATSSSDVEGISVEFALKHAAIGDASQTITWVSPCEIAQGDSFIHPKDSVVVAAMKRLAHGLQDNNDKIVSCALFALLLGNDIVAQYILDAGARWKSSADAPSISNFHLNCMDAAYAMRHIPFADRSELEAAVMRAVAVPDGDVVKRQEKLAEVIKNLQSSRVGV